MNHNCKRCLMGIVSDIYTENYAMNRARMELDGG